VGVADAAVAYQADEPFDVTSCPLETALAENIVTMVDRGDTTARERDVADVHLRVCRHVGRPVAGQGSSGKEVQELANGYAACS
jgi:hypothetical protein